MDASVVASLCGSSEFNHCSRGFALPARPAYLPTTKLLIVVPKMKYPSALFVGEYPLDELSSLLVTEAILATC